MTNKKEQKEMDLLVEQDNNLNIFAIDLIKLFADKTGCDVQTRNCPCNTCFHSLDNNINFKHILWLILLRMRGDYKDKIILKDIKRELK